MKHIILTALLLAPGMSPAREVVHKGDVTDIRVIRRVEQHPEAWRLWQPFIIQGEKKRHLIVAFGAGVKNSYPTLVEVAPGDFRAVWDSGTADTPRTHLRFGKFRIQP